MAASLMENREQTREMARLYKEQGLTFGQIGVLYGMSRQAVHERIKRSGISLPARAPKEEAIDKERLKDLYSVQRLSLNKIAEALGSTYETVRCALKIHKIPKREPLKHGGYKVDFLRALSVGETKEFVFKREKPYAQIHAAADKIGIKISMRLIEVGGGGERKFKITRLS